MMYSHKSYQALIEVTRAYADRQIAIMNLLEELPWQDSGNISEQNGRLLKNAQGCKLNQRGPDNAT